MRARRSGAPPPTSSWSSARARTSRRPRRRSRASTRRSTRGRSSAAARVACSPPGARSKAALRSRSGLRRCPAGGRPRSTPRRRRCLTASASAACPNRRGPARRCSCSPIRTRSRPTARSPCSPSGHPAPPCSAGSRARGRSTATPRCFSVTAACRTARSACVLDGVELLPCVSQGAAAIGPEMQITAVDGHVIRELDGQPALAALREAIESLAPGERELVSGGLLLGIVDRRPPRRSGPRPTTSCAGSSAPIPRPARSRSAPRSARARSVRLHARDAASADRDLRDGLELRAQRARRRPGRGARLHLQRSRALDVRRRPTTTPMPSTRSSAARRVGRLLRRRRDRAGRRRELPARLHRDGRGVRQLTLTDC